MLAKNSKAFSILQAVCLLKLVTIAIVSANGTSKFNYQDINYNEGANCGH